MSNKSKKMNELVAILNKNGISTRECKMSCAQRAINGVPKELISVIHDEDGSVKGKRGFIECGIHIEGRFVENEDIINALKKLKCWLPDTKESINIDRPMIFDKRWKKKHKGKVQGRWFVYRVFDKNASANDIANEKIDFFNKNMKLISEAINKNFN